jgi:hypothetical protein
MYFGDSRRLEPKCRSAAAKSAKLSERLRAGDEEGRVGAVMASTDFVLSRSWSCVRSQVPLEHFEEIERETENRA